MEVDTASSQLIKQQKKPARKQHGGCRQTGNAGSNKKPARKQHGCFEMARELKKASTQAGLEVAPLVTSLRV